MNISFHYFTVKTLCCLAGLQEGRAQNIAYYSQLVDDFNLSWLNPGDGIYVSKEPPLFFMKNGLAMKTRKDLWYLYPVTTGITIFQSFASLLNGNHQKYTIIPFHFIPREPYDKIKGKDLDLVCRQTEPGQRCLMNTLLDEFFQKDLSNDRKLGLLLHVYADTYAHQHFSGRWGYENYAKIQWARDNSKTPPMEVGNKVKPYYIAPAVGHAELAHVPDTFALSFQADFTADKQVYGRDNMDTFLLCAKRIWKMLRDYNHQPHMDEKYFDQKIAPRIKEAGNACVDGASEIMDPQKLAGIWHKVFPEYQYQYYYDESWGLNKVPGTEEEEKLGKTVYEPTEEFYQYNEMAYKHLRQVCHSYRLEEYL